MSLISKLFRSFLYKLDCFYPFFLSERVHTGNMDEGDMVFRKSEQTISVEY